MLPSILHYQYTYFSGFILLAAKIKDRKHSFSVITIAQLKSIMTLIITSQLLIFLRQDLLTKSSNL